MQYPPARLVWKPRDGWDGQFILSSPEWLWSFAQVVHHPAGSWTSRVGLHRVDTMTIGIDAPNERLAKRWAETWVRRNWNRIEAQMIERGNSSGYRTIDYRVFAGRGLAPPDPETPSRRDSVKA